MTQLENKENIDYLLVFSYFRTPEDDIKIIDDKIKNLNNLSLLSERIQTKLK